MLSEIQMAACRTRAIAGCVKRVVVSTRLRSSGRLIAGRVSTNADDRDATVPQGVNC